MGSALAAVASSSRGAALVLAPWVVRNKVEVGCYAITTDSRALWKANNPNTYDVLARGGWIDDVPPLPGAPPWPELAADLTLAGQPTTVDECAQMRLYRDEVLDFWREEPGEKPRLARQAVRMLWNPVPRPSRTRAGAAARDIRADASSPRSWSPSTRSRSSASSSLRAHFVALALLLLAYNTLAAMVFAGAARYRAPWDFLLALLAAFSHRWLCELSERGAAGYAGSSPSARA